MRINLRTLQQPSTYRDFMQHLNRLFANEYQISEDKSWRYFSHPDKDIREPVVEYLKEQGWKITNYELPKFGDTGSASYGYVIADDCEKLLVWTLANT